MNEQNDATEADDNVSSTTESQSLSERERLDLLKWVLDNVQSQIRFADSKASFVLFFHIFLFSFITSQAETLASVPHEARGWIFVLRGLLFAVYAVLAIVSIGYAVSAVIPRFGVNADMSKIFFGHIVAGYERNVHEYNKAISQMSKSEWLKDVSGQIVENSNIAQTKHKRARTAALWALASVVLAFFGVLLSLVA